MSLPFSFWVFRVENLQWAVVVVFLIAQGESVPAPSGKIQLSFTCLRPQSHLISGKQESTGRYPMGWTEL